MLLLDRFNSIKALEAFARPVAFLIAENDTTTPPEGARRLFESLTGPKKLWSVPGADHNNAVSDLPPAQWRELWDFISPG